VSGGFVLVLNCGSSSVKLALVDPVTGERRLTGLAERVGSSDAVVRLRRDDGDEESGTPDDPS
jgi:acetate kinase